MLILRRATQDDVREIVRIAAAGWRHTYPGLISPETIEDTLGRWYSAETILRRLAAPPLHVAESAGKKVERDARDGGKSAIEPWVLQGNRFAIGWYDRQGGSVVGRRDI
jgi:hypothetical protein